MKTELQKAIQKLKSKYDADDIFIELIKGLNMKEEAALNEACLDFVRFTPGVNIVKTENLTQQMQLEAAMKELFPLHSDQQSLILSF